jgi:hypothetical protein
MGSDRQIDWSREPINLGRGPLILLFYDGYERRARRSLYARNTGEIRRTFRYLWRLLQGRQLRTGFYTQFINLVSALTKSGCDVRINDYKLADKFLSYPIGVAGYPSVLNHIPKNHPVLFGPGDFGMPDTFRRLCDDCPDASLICFCDWIAQIYEPMNPGKTKKWFAGIDIDKWKPETDSEKMIDCLIYDKVRWRREKLIPNLYSRMQAHLDRRGLKHETLHYGAHTIRQYKHSLKKTKSLIFLCEHETQGLAYQEAMSMNIPIFAWNEGVLCDDELRKFSTEKIQVTSVPYFSGECGICFQLENMLQQFDVFWTNLLNYKPRNFVLNNLSLDESAALYLRSYFR